MLRFEANGSRIRYVRSCRGDRKELYLDGSLDLRLVPMYPVFYPKFVSQFILCRFSTPIVVPPSNEVVLYFEFPVDVALYAYSGKQFRILDVLPIHTYARYCLYGPLDVGVVARCFKVDTCTEPPKPRPFYAIARLVLRNSSGRVVVVTKVLLDASPLKLFYVPGRWEVYTQNLELNIVGEKVGYIYYGKPFVKNVVAIDDPEELKPPKIGNRTDMLWGF